jgi:hypothetical protein
MLDGEVLCEIPVRNVKSRDLKRSKTLRTGLQTPSGKTLYAGRGLQPRP